ATFDHSCLGDYINRRVDIIPLSQGVMRTRYRPSCFPRWQTDSASGRRRQGDHTALALWFRHSSRSSLMSETQMLDSSANREEGQLTPKHLAAALLANGM